MRNDDKLWREWEADVDRVLRSQIEGLYREADEAEDTSSPEFLERMNELLGMEEQERPKRTHRRKHAKVAKVAGVAALFALLIGVSQMNPNADWSFDKLFEKVYDEFVLGSSDDKVVLTEVGPEVNNQIAEQFPGVYVLTKLPEGYELSEVRGNSSKFIALYYSDGENIIILNQRSFSDDIDGQDGEKEEANLISQNGITYKYSEKRDQGTVSNTLAWKIGSMEFDLIGPYSETDLISMAESLEVV